MWNRRFELYAKSQGLTPETVLERDIKNYPGGKMAGFLCWSSRQVEEWRTATKSKPQDASLYPERVTKWLEENMA